MFQSVCTVLSSLARLASDRAFALHRDGKIEIRPTVEVRDEVALSLAYTPGVAGVCTAIADDPALAYGYTWVAGTVAVVSDGSAVLGLGDIGPAAAMPVMEGKALLFKQFAGWMPSRCAWPAPMWTRSSIPWPASRPRSAGSTWKTSARRAASRSKTRLREAPRHPGVPRRSAWDRDRGARRAARCGGVDRQVARRDQGGRGGRGRVRRGGHQDPAVRGHRRYRGLGPQGPDLPQAGTGSTRSRRRSRATRTRPA